MTTQSRAINSLIAHLQAKQQASLEALPFGNRMGTLQAYYKGAEMTDGNYQIMVVARLVGGKRLFTLTKSHNTHQIWDPARITINLKDYDLWQLQKALSVANRITYYLDAVFDPGTDAKPWLELPEL